MREQIPPKRRGIGFRKTRVRLLQEIRKGSSFAMSAVLESLLPATFRLRVIDIWVYMYTLSGWIWLLVPSPSSLFHNVVVYMKFILFQMRKCLKLWSKVSNILTSNRSQKVLRIPVVLVLERFCVTYIHGTLCLRCNPIMQTNLYSQTAQTEISYVQCKETRNPLGKLTRKWTFIKAIMTYVRQGDNFHSYRVSRRFEERTAEQDPFRKCKSTYLVALCRRIPTNIYALCLEVSIHNDQRPPPVPFESNGANQVNRLPLTPHGYLFGKVYPHQPYPRKRETCRPSPLSYPI